MPSWRDQILNEFTPKVSKLTLVADPDRLLLEEKILEGIRQRGFELILFEDHVAFRYAYESKFRQRWDRGDDLDLVVVLHSKLRDLSLLPYDLLMAGRKLSFSLGDIFPNMSYPVLDSLDRADLDDLYEAQEKHCPEKMGENATKDFILNHIFQIVPSMIRQPSELLRMLLRRHYSLQRLPDIFCDRFVHLLRQDRSFDGWPLETLIRDEELFYNFLQERWPIFIEKEISKCQKDIKEEAEQYKLSIKGPSEVPFDHPDIRVYIDNLFAEGILQPIDQADGQLLAGSWVNVGIVTDSAQRVDPRLVSLVEILEEKIPSAEAKYTEWMHYAKVWAELTTTLNNDANIIQQEMKEKIGQLQSRMDVAFHEWLSRRYAGLINLPPDMLTMLHHIPKYLANQIEDNANSRIALIVIDGLALDQWLVIKKALSTALPQILIREESSFAWLPTLTSVSRQSIFAGTPPCYFPGSIYKTDKEAALWQKFWVDRGFEKNEVGYAKGLGDGSLKDIRELIDNHRHRILGLVIDKVDRIMHGMEMGAIGMHNQIDQWARQGYLKELVTALLDGSYQVFITSDHGNIEAEGCGRISEGVIADIRGERARIYPDESLRRKIKEQNPEAIEWDPVGLPQDYFPLMAPYRKAFIQPEKKTVCHGGISLEEIIVPFIKIERKET